MVFMAPLLETGWALVTALTTEVQIKWWHATSKARHTKNIHLYFIFLEYMETNYHAVRNLSSQWRDLHRKRTVSWLTAPVEFPADHLCQYAKSWEWVTLKVKHQLSTWGGSAETSYPCQALPSWTFMSNAYICSFKPQTEDDLWCNGTELMQITNITLWNKIMRTQL